MKKIPLFVALLAMLSFISCKKDPQPSTDYAAGIEGRWVDMTGTFAPDWHYHFEDGLLTQHYFKAGVTLSILSYPYAIRDSTVIIGGDATNAPRGWRLNFECSDVVQVIQYSPQFGQRFWLKREAQ